MRARNHCVSAYVIKVAYSRWTEALSCISSLITCFCFPAYALAELVDNALSATVKNTGVRTIEIRMVGSADAYYLFSFA